MMKAITLSQVDAAISAAVGNASYIRGMWRYVLEHADMPDGDVPQSVNCDAVPYVPVQPEKFGVELTAESLVLDIGCLGGYGLYDFYLRRERHCLPLPHAVGIDVNLNSVRVAESLAGQWAPSNKVRFLEAGAEAIPLDERSVDVVIARLVLPYVRLQKTVEELERVLKSNSLCLIQTHAPRYYWRKFFQVMPKPKQMWYYLKPIMNGYVFAVTGRQVGKETAMSVGVLKRLFGPIGMEAVWEGGFAAKPMVVFRKKV